jgi:riboflavin kinase/FMN adenylyltransferase
VDEVGISSTKIRENLNSGDLQSANKYLGYNYSLTGRVGIGQQLGRKIGFPTANLEISDINKLIPTDGVYAIKALIENKRVEGMMNIGFRPTVKGEAKTIEANLFNFEKEIYRKIIKIEIIEKIREEQRFDSIENLREQLLEDRKKALEILNTNERI